MAATQPPQYANYFRVQDINPTVNNCKSYPYDITFFTDSPLNDDVFSLLSDFRKLEDNWDGYGGIRPSDEVIKLTEKLLNLVPNRFIESLGIDNVYPNPHGTITIEWENQREEIVSIEVGSKSSSFFAQFADGELLAANNINLAERIPFEFFSSLNRLFSH